MSLFRKNPNESAYTGGKKHIADVIKNTASGDFLVWRQPEEDFNDGSTLIVMPGEEAVFIKGGIIEQVFSNGTYLLSTENYPFIGRLWNARTGGISVFNCVVYFVKKSLSVEVKWGTDSPIQVRDKKLGIATKLKARGSYKLAVDNAGAFISKLVGNNTALEKPQDLEDYFFGEFQGKIKSVIAKEINDREEELLGIDARLGDFSEAITPLFQEVLGSYGLKCINFTVSAIDIDDSELRAKYDAIGMDAYEQSRQGDVKAENTIKQGRADAEVKLKEGLVEAQIMIAKGKAQKEVMDALGEHGWSKQQAAEILKSLASNSGGDFALAGAGFGVGMAMSTPFANLASQMTSPLTAPTPSAQSGQKEAGEISSDPVLILGKLKNMLDSGLITEAEYNEKKKEILSRI